MYYVRAAALLAVLGSTIFFAGCGGGSGGAAPPLPAGAMPGSSASNPVKTQSNKQQQTLYTISGPIVALKSSGGFQMNGGPGIGYVNVYPTSETQKNYNGLQPEVGYYAVVEAQTNQGGTPLVIDLSKTMSTISGPIVALKGSGGFQMNGGKGIGYINIYPTSETIENYNGQQIQVGLNAVVQAETSQGGSPLGIGLNQGGTPSPTPEPTGGPVPKHVLTAGIVYGYGGTPTSVPLDEVSPYVSWAMPDEQHAAELRSAGVKVDIYTNFWRNYESDNPNVGYVDLEPGGKDAGAEAKDCQGHVLKDPSYGGGYESNAYTTDAQPHASDFVSYRENEYAGNYDAVYEDDVGAVGGMVPCNYELSTYITYTNSVTASLQVPTFINTLNAGASAVSQAGYANASNVLGAMCESCLAYWTSINGQNVDEPRYGSTWADELNAEILLASEQKIDWQYARAIGSASSETALRMYTYASFLLAYDPNYSMLEEAFATPSKLEIFPESGLVPEQPVTTESSVSGYETSTGAYMRQFGACYYRGVNEGKCAVVINPNTSSVSMPSNTYGHAMTLSGAGVIDGGTASFTGSKPSSLGATSAAILFP